LRRLAYKLGLLLARIKFVRSAIDDQADLSAFDHKPTVKIVVGVSMVAFSFVMGWPAISALGTFALFIRRPMLAVIGGPILYGLSHLCFLGGMALAGAKYSRLFFRWCARKFTERLLSFGPPSPESTHPQTGQPLRPPIQLLTPASSDDH
jgi:hypothetical protein